ncbi:MAG: osmoprotectant NAGGN system M42 family peptidase [Desulfobacteraceae bacterium]|nr:osmoprotectant NAGGN system M42 family peptidase [Desulfobacteraceae bacterium]
MDEGYLTDTLVSLLSIHSPAGYTDQIVHFVGDKLADLGIDFNVTRRGAIRATLPGRQNTFDRALAVHLDTLGAMVRELKKNGRLAASPIGTWSSRFAEGARVTVFNSSGPQRGTVLPLKASGHVYGEAIDTQPVSWDQVEVRIDEKCCSKEDLLNAGYNVGDFIAFDAVPEITSSGFLNARHIDDKAGAAILLTLAKNVADHQVGLPVECDLLFTISEEVGSGASAVLYGDVAEMVTIDHAPVASDQNSSEFGITIGMMDQTGPFDYHLSRKLIELSEEFGLEHSRDVFRFYRTDSASAIQAGNDTRTALVGYGVDGSHGYERTHMESLFAVADLLGLYVQSPPLFMRDKDDLSSLKGFPHQPSRDVIRLKT